MNALFQKAPCKNVEERNSKLASRAFMRPFAVSQRMVLKNKMIQTNALLQNAPVFHLLKNAEGMN